MNGGIKFNTLAVGKTQHFIIIQDGVHVFYPQSIHRAVTYDPFVIFRGVLENQQQDDY